MSRFRRKRSSGGGGGMGRALPIIGMVFGCVAMLVCLICFNIAVGTIDTTYTSAASYADQVGLTSVVGLAPLLVFLVFMAVGLAAIGGSAYMQLRSSMAGGWMDIFIGIVMGTAGIIIALILNNLIITQLHTVQVTVNATTNVANFSGIVSILTIWGMIIFLTILGGGLASLAGAGIGAYRRVKGTV